MLLRQRFYCLKYLRPVWMWRLLHSKKSFAMRTESLRKPPFPVKWHKSEAKLMIYTIEGVILFPRRTHRLSTLCVCSFYSQRFQLFVCIQNNNHNQQHNNSLNRWFRLSAPPNDQEGTYHRTKPTVHNFWRTEYASTSAFKEQQQRKTLIHKITLRFRNVQGEHSVEMWTNISKQH